MRVNFFAYVVNKSVGACSITTGPCSSSQKALSSHFRAGFTKIYVQSTSPHELEFIKEFSKRVIPYFEAQEQ